LLKAIQRQELNTTAGIKDVSFEIERWKKAVKMSFLGIFSLIFPIMPLRLLYYVFLYGIMRKYDLLGVEPLMRSRRPDII
jgi:hypothetical protein